METEAAAIGIDFGGTTIKSAVVKNGAIIVRGNVIDTLAAPGSDALISALVAEIKRLCSKHGGCGGRAERGKNESKIVALGIGLPGITDSIHGIVRQLSNVPGWREVPLRDILRERTGLHTAIENDANAMAYAEWKFGAARGGRNVVCVTLGTGVGGGLILNGELFRGSYLGAGEIGQMSIHHEGVPGNYGNFGAIEKYVGNAQIAERAQKLFAEEKGERLSLDECSPAELARRAESGDETARKLWQRIGTEIGAALANVVWLLNPDAIVIGGGIAKAGELLFEPIRRTIRARTMPVFFENLQIVPAALGNDAGIIGSAAIALDTRV